MFQLQSKLCPESQSNLHRELGKAELSFQMTSSSTLCMEQEKINVNTMNQIFFLACIVLSNHNNPYGPHAVYKRKLYWKVIIASDI